jgi:hypothetical protein
MNGVAVTLLHRLCRVNSRFVDYYRPIFDEGRGTGQPGSSSDGFQPHAFCILIYSSLPRHSSKVGAVCVERPYGSVRGAIRNDRPYRVS